MKRWINWSNKQKERRSSYSALLTTNQSNKTYLFVYAGSSSPSAFPGVLPGSPDCLLASSSRQEASPCFSDSSNPSSATDELAAGFISLLFRHSVLFFSSACLILFSIFIF